MTRDPVQGLVEELDRRLASLGPTDEHHGAFLATYRRTTQAVAAAQARGLFEDPAWVQRWTVTFGRYYLGAHDAEVAGRMPPRPWRLAFSVAPDAHPLAHLLVGMNAHINYDLPQAMLEVISPTDFDDPELLRRRVRDHERVNGVLAARVAAEDGELSGPRRLVDRLLTPVNRSSSRRFLAEARAKVWDNVGALHEARSAGAEAYRARLAELEVLSAAKVADLLRPGQVLLRLAVTGFGVRLPPP